MTRQCIEVTDDGQRITEPPEWLDGVLAFRFMGDTLLTIQPLTFERARVTRGRSDDHVGWSECWDYERLSEALLHIRFPEREPRGWLRRTDHEGNHYPEKHFTCPRCERRSHNEKDIEEGYCGNCHDWTKKEGLNA